jgi:hypothetical protein
MIFVCTHTHTWFKLEVNNQFLSPIRERSLELELSSSTWHAKPHFPPNTWQKPISLRTHVSPTQLRHNHSSECSISINPSSSSQNAKNQNTMHRFKSSLGIPKPTAYNFISSRFSHLETAGPVASLLKSRSVVRFRGPDTVKFLQGLLTNDVRRFGEPMGERTSTLPTVSVPPMYAALLTPQGRFLYDLFLYRPPRPDAKLDRTGSGPGPDPDESLELFADVDATVLDELLETFKK